MRCVRTMTNELLDKSGFMANEFSVVFGPPDKQMPADYFLSNYRSIMIRYISDGNPSDDTKTSYFSAIDLYLDWCKKLNLNPFKVTEQQMLYYRSVLINNKYKASTIKFRLTAIRRFYYVAIKYKMIETNPAMDVHAQRDPDAYIPVLQFLTADQLNKLIDSIDINDDNNEKALRNKVMIYLMAVEGLRTVEIHRMNTQDINNELGAIYIRGKGHNDMIYPTATTMKLLSKYINIRTYQPVYPTPVFTSTSNRSSGKRLSRQRIRSNISEILDAVQLKNPGKACHMLRHTCGTLLYSETKDLQVVKQVLRHRNIEITSRYAHVQDGMLKRYTTAIPVKP